jgi:hypothetical protein
MLFDPGSRIVPAARRSGPRSICGGYALIPALPAAQPFAAGGPCELEAQLDVGAIPGFDFSGQGGKPLLKRTDLRQQRIAVR